MAVICIQVNRLLLRARKQATCSVFHLRCHGALWGKCQQPIKNPIVYLKKKKERKKKWNHPPPPPPSSLEFISPWKTKKRCLKYIAGSYN